MKIKLQNIKNNTNICFYGVLELKEKIDIIYNIENNPIKAKNSTEIILTTSYNLKNNISTHLKIGDVYTVASMLTDPLYTTTVIFIEKIPLKSNNNYLLKIILQSLE